MSDAQRNSRRAIKEMMLTLAGYLALLCGSLAILKRVELGPWKYVVVLMPMLPCALTVVVVRRAIVTSDELQRKMSLDALAFAFAGTALVTFSYGFLEGAGLPRVSWIWVWPVMGVLWMLGNVVSKLNYR